MLLGFREPKVKGSPKNQGVWPEWVYSLVLGKAFDSRCIA